MNDEVATRASECALVFAADENFAEGLGVAVHSALAHLPESFSPSVHVIDNGLSEDALARLSRTVATSRPGVELRTVRIAAEGLGPITDESHVTATKYSRLLVGDLLPPQISRAVYLDSDILVRRDISQLFSLDLEGKPVAGARDFFTSSTADELSGVRDKANARPYFNSGVLVIDLAAWRAGSLGERVLEYARLDPPLRLADQDALNGVIEHWHELDRRWNVQQLPVRIFAREFPREPTEREAFMYRQRRNLYRSAAILHFIGGAKPWDHTCVTTGTNAWVRALMRSRWYTPGEMVRWLMRWQAPRLRYRIGTWRRRVF